jgi:hypothetical protein
MTNIPDKDLPGESEEENARPHLNLHDGQDIHDSPKDRHKLRGEEFTIDLPDVSDIPGQEHVHVPQLNQFSDTTIASDDEEGVGLFDEDAQEDEFIMGTEADVDAVEKRALRSASEDILSSDNAALREASLDNRDEEGELLNEGSSGTRLAGTDLDMAVVEQDDQDEAVGEEDEENNHYSLGGDDNDEPGSEKF